MLKRIMAVICCIPLMLNIPLATIHKLKGELQHKKLKNPSVEKDIITKTLIQMRKKEKLKIEQEELKRIEELEKEKQRLLELEVKKLEEKENQTKLQDEQKNSKTREITRNTQGRKVTLNVSHYCNCYECCQNTSNIGKTASGANAQAGVTIAMPSNIPFGTRVQIGNNIYTVQDRGGAIVNNGNTIHVDVYVNSHSEALRLGRYVTEGYILN